MSKEKANRQIIIKGLAPLYYDNNRLWCEIVYLRKYVDNVSDMLWEAKKLIQEAEKIVNEAFNRMRLYVSGAGLSEIEEYYSITEKGNKQYDIMLEEQAKRRNKEKLSTGYKISSFGPPYQGEDKDVK